MRNRVGRRPVRRSAGAPRHPRQSEPPPEPSGPGPHLGAREDPRPVACWPPPPRASAPSAPTHVHSREHVSRTYSTTTSSASSAARPWLSWLNTSSRSCFNLRAQEMKHKGDTQG